MYFGNKDTGTHTGGPWVLPGSTSPERCVIDGCDQRESAAVHRDSYAAGGHRFMSERMADMQAQAERDAEAAYDEVMREAGY